MVTLLKEKLGGYLQQNNPELLLDLQAKQSVTQYLEDKVRQVMPFVLEMIGQGKAGYIIEELAIKSMTEELRPSRFNYLQEILEREFYEDFAGFLDAGVLTYETINLLEKCNEVFDTFHFCEDTEDNRFLRYAIIASVHEYLN